MTTAPKPQHTPDSTIAFATMGDYARLTAERDRLRAVNAELVAEVDRLRVALKRCESWLTNTNSETVDGRLIDRREEFPVEWKIIDFARAALARAKE